jgi:hypothetical protein
MVTHPPTTLSVPTSTTACICSGIDFSSRRIMIRTMRTFMRVRTSLISEPNESALVIYHRCRSFIFNSEPAMTTKELTGTVFSLPGKRFTAQFLVLIQLTSILRGRRSGYIAVIRQHFVRGWHCSTRISPTNLTYISGINLVC